MILLGGYNKLVKGYQITKKAFMISCSDGVRTQIKLLFGVQPEKRLGTAAVERFAFPLTVLNNIFTQELNLNNPKV